MSTEGQQYSLANQAAAIQEYAGTHGIQIVRSYEDAGRSGVTVHRRTGLASLIADVIAGQPGFDLILVLDVSRWGRFQDPDEAAHYEFLCRGAGVDVCYCAEGFKDDPGGKIIKQIKRIMAGEYSRELSAKVVRGKRRKAELGYVPGAPCPYGLQRQEVLPDGSPGRILARRDRKARPEYGLRFIPGLAAEQAIAKRIFRFFVHRQMAPQQIARKLSSEGITYSDGTVWTKQRVSRLLRCELLVGEQITGRTIRRMGRPIIYRPQSAWETLYRFQPVVAPNLFAAAKRRRLALNGSNGKTDREMLDDLIKVWRRHGSISTTLIERSIGEGKVSAYFRRFGTLTKAYEKIGYRYERGSRGITASGALMGKEAVVERLKRLQELHGRVSTTIMQHDEVLPSAYMIRKLFGSVPAAYAAAGVTWGRASNRQT